MPQHVLHVVTREARHFARMRGDDGGTIAKHSGKLVQLPIKCIQGVRVNHDRTAPRSQSFANEPLDLIIAAESGTDQYYIGPVTNCRRRILERSGQGLWKTAVHR